MRASIRKGPVRDPMLQILIVSGALQLTRMQVLPGSIETHPGLSQPPMWTT